MARAYSQDLRDRLIAAIEAGMSCRAAALRFGVSATTAINWRQRWLAQGDVAAKPMGGATRTRIKGADAAWLLQQIADEDDLTLHMMQARLKAERKLSAAIGSIWRFLDANRITLKKNSGARRTGPGGRRRSPGEVDTEPTAA